MILRLSGHFCDVTCERMVNAGMTQAKMRRHVKRAAAEGGSTREEINSPDFFDYLKAVEYQVFTVACAFPVKGHMARWPSIHRPPAAS
jgi:hypothetical protein